MSGFEPTKAKNLFVISLFSGLSGIGVVLCVVMLPSKRKTRMKSRRPVSRLNRFSANRTILRPTDRTTFRREPNFTTRHARRNFRELFRFHLQRQSSEQSSYALYVSLPQSKFGRSMLAVRKAYSERSLHVSVHRKTGDF